MNGTRSEYESENASHLCSAADSVRQRDKRGPDNPIDDKAAAAAGDWMNDFTKNNMKPAFFRNPVHCVKISKEGLIYVCDRGNNRIQVFNGRDPNLGKECLNPNGEADKCGFVKEQFVAVKTNGLPINSFSVSSLYLAKQNHAATLE